MMKMTGMKRKKLAEVLAAEVTKVAPVVAAKVEELADKVVPTLTAKKVLNPDQ